MIGIDLGTTNSLVCVFRDGKPEVLPNELGDQLTPSVVAIAEDKHVLVGRAARDRMIRDNASGKACFKRDMGTEARYQVGKHSWSPQECSAMILREMKRIAELHLEEAVKEAVISVPAYFHDQQRQATMDAAKIAGLEVSRMINEPTAAALAYGYRQPDEEKLIMVFDLGGGTFDVTMLEVFDGVIEVKASGGESRLGGEDYTTALERALLKQHRWTPPKGEEGLFRQQVEMLKRRLSEQETATIKMGEEEVVVERELFRKATADLTARIRPVVHRCCRDAGVSPNEIDDILLVGGASRMFVISELLAADFGRLPNASLDADLVVGLGASIQAALSGREEAVEDLVLTDVSPHSLGVEVTKEFSANMLQDGYFSPIIDRNTTVPVSRSDLFHTLHPMQEEMRLKIYQGESRLVKDNHLLGELAIKGVRAKDGDGRTSVEVRFSYDMNGILEVEATVLSTGKKASKIIEQRPGVLTKAQIEEAIRRLAPLKIHPRDKLPNRARLERANRLFMELIGEHRTTLQILVDQFESALQSQEEASIEQAGSVLDQFMDPFFQEEALRPTEPDRD